MARLLKNQKVLFCGRCYDLKSFHSCKFVSCRCGNMAARFKTPARHTVEVIAVRKELARVIETNSLLLKHWAKLLKVGEVQDVQWSPKRQKEIDAGRKLVVDYLNYENGQVRFNGHSSNGSSLRAHRARYGPHQTPAR